MIIDVQSAIATLDKMSIPVESIAVPGAPLDVNTWSIDLSKVLQMPAREFAGMCSDVNVGLLDNEERTRASRYHRNDDSVRYAAMRVVLKSLLAAIRCVQPGEVMLSVEAKGKPYWKDQSLHFNISHSNSFGYIALSERRRIGVDIEEMINIDVQELASMVLTDEERRRWLSSPEDVRAQLFYRLWTCKEAILKASGLGIADDLKCFSIAALSEQAEDVSVLSSAPEATARQLALMRVMLLRAPAGYAAALAYDADSSRTEDAVLC
jgi:4'-phosphopantetheinyl transferase